MLSAHGGQWQEHKWPIIVSYDSKALRSNPREIQQMCCLNFKLQITLLFRESAIRVALFKKKQLVQYPKLHISSKYFIKPATIGAFSLKHNSRTVLKFIELPEFCRPGQRLPCAPPSSRRRRQALLC